MLAIMILSYIGIGEKTKISVTNVTLHNGRTMTSPNKGLRYFPLFQGYLGFISPQTNKGHDLAS